MKKVFLVMLAAAVAACSEGTTGAVSLAMSAAPLGVATAPQVTTAGDSTVIALGSDTIVLRSVQVVLREIELKPIEDAACDTVGNDDGCEEFEAGAVLASLPLGTTATETMISVSAPPGQYDQLEFKIHKPESSDDAAFIAANPTFDGVSIRVSGTYSQAGTRSDFVFTSDLDAQQEVELAPPITVSAGAGTSVTLRVDVSTWFLDVGGTALVDPASANKGQVNEGVVKDRIQASIDAFRDDDHDGHDDDDPNDH